MPTFTTFFAPNLSFFRGKTERFITYPSRKTIFFASKKPDFIEKTAFFRCLYTKKCTTICMTFQTNVLTLETFNQNLIHTMMKKAKLKVLLSMSFMLVSCIEEYNIQETLPLETPDIVIQGRIASGSESVFYLSKTQPIGSEEKAESILNAEITIVGQNGYESPKATFNMEDDCYIINTQELPNNTLYSVLIKAEGETYQSEFQELFITPSIESVSHKEREDGISIHVTSYGNEDNSPYYLWAYEEDWEFHAPANINGLKGIPVYSKEIYNLPFMDENGNNPYLYCWGHNSSKHINIPVGGIEILVF